MTDEDRDDLLCHAADLVLVGQEVLISSSDHVPGPCSAAFYSLYYLICTTRKMCVCLCVFAFMWVNVSHTELPAKNMKLDDSARAFLCVSVCVFDHDCKMKSVSLQRPL